MTKPVFSILTPTYNCGNFVLRSYHSLLSQTNTDWEWIVVDDGSTDETKDIINKIGDDRIKFYRYNINKGRGFARNFGLSKCIGEIIVVWDIDDIYLPDRLENVYNAIITEKFDFMVSKAIVVDNNFNVKGLRGFNSNELYKDFVHPTLAFSKNVKDSIYYDKDMRAGEDLLVMIELYNKHKGKYLDESLMLYFEDREVNINKTIQAHNGHMGAICKVLNDKTVKLNRYQILNIKSKLYFKKILLRLFLLYPPAYIKTVKLRNIDKDINKDIFLTVERIKIANLKLTDKCKR